MRIGLDCDGVICDWVGSVIRHLNHYRKTFIPPDFQPPSWDWFKENLSEEDWLWIWRGGCQTIFAEASPYPGARQFVEELNELRDIIILTARPKPVWSTTKQWWEKNFYPICPAGFNFFYSGLQKYKVHTDVFIEDNLNYANAYAHKWLMPEVFLLDRPWNQGYNEYLNVTRVPNYEAILQEIKRLKNESTC